MIQDPGDALLWERARDGDSGSFACLFDRYASAVYNTDGRTVTASRSGGYFLAWWPSGADAASITAYDSAGHVVAVAHPASAHPVAP